MMYGAWREAFVIRDVVDGIVRDIGFHVRLAPRKEGEKASWRYSNRWVEGERLECETSRGLGAWPFVVLPEGGIEAAKYIFCCEGQWDALALIDVMGEVRAPVLALFGAFDRAGGVQSARLLRERVPGCRIALAPDAGADVDVERPHLAARLIREFFSVRQR
jgi:pimeloyl-ACP methyl ester carboxylesterase